MPEVGQVTEPIEPTAIQLASMFWVMMWKMSPAIYLRVRNAGPEPIRLYVRSLFLAGNLIMTMALFWHQLWILEEVAPHWVRYIFYMLASTMLYWTGSDLLGTRERVEDEDDKKGEKAK